MSEYEIDALKKRIDELEKMDAEGKQALESLRKSEEKYRHLFENSQAGIYRSRIDGSAILEVNEKWLQILGYSSKEEIVGKPAPIVWAHPEKREPFIQQLKEKGVATDYEIDLLTKSGATKTCLISASIFPTEGIIEGTILDITELEKTREETEEARAYLEGLISSMVDGLWVIDLQGKSIDVNSAMVKMVGYESRDELLKKNPADITAARDSEKTARLIKEPLGGKPSSNELNIIRKDGKEIKVSISATALKNPEGKITGAFAIIRDITERKNMEDDLKKKIRDLEAFHKVAVGRELRMEELKKRIKELEEKLKA